MNTSSLLYRPVPAAHVFDFVSNRLYWPKSKSFDYLYSDGEALLRNFPVQATISFYEESDSEDESEEDEDDDSEECLKQPSHFTSYN